MLESQFYATFVSSSLLVFVATHANSIFKAETCDVTLSARPWISGVNAFASVYLLKADTLHTAGDVVNLWNCDFTEYIQSVRFCHENCRCC